MELIKKKRTANFREDETKLLIQLWGSPSIQDKLSLTHRKAPVMRLLASNMQQRGFYRTSDEIKTRIRNLKCLYHRIKRTMACGTGIGTVDPDWPHFKAMDEIMSKEYASNLSDITLKDISSSLLDDMQMKNEIKESDANATDESNTNTDLTKPIPTDISPEPSTIENKEKNEEKEQNSVETPPQEISKTLEGSIQVKNISTMIAPSPQQPQPQQHVNVTSGKNPNVMQTPPKIQPLLPNGSSGQTPQSGSGSSNNIPFPFLILNHLNNNGDRDIANRASVILNNLENNEQSMMSLLKETVELQKQNLEINKQKLEIEKQRLENEHLIERQLFNIVQRLDFSGSEDHVDLKPEFRRKRLSEESKTDSDSNILRNLLDPNL